MSAPLRAAWKDRAAEDLEDWRLRGECVDEDPEIWFAESTARARKICDGCPVREICLKDALDTGDFYGVRGGRTGRQRMFLARGNRPPVPNEFAKYNAARSAKGEKTRAAILELALTDMSPRDIGATLSLTRGTVWSYLAALREQGELPSIVTRYGPPRRPIKHGTRSGYYTHQKRQETPCDACKAGMREYEAARREAQKAASS